MQNSVILKPIVSEKGTDLNAFDKYLFEVAANTTKPEIKKAVESNFKVKVTAVNIINQKGKSRRRGRTEGKTKDIKKAVVTLKKGDKIEIFEGV